MNNTPPEQNKPRQEEANLLRAFRAGDAGAFDSLCRRLEAPLFSFALRLVQNRSEAQDIAQEALFRLYQKATSGHLDTPGASPRPYTFSIAHNLAMDYHRKGRRVLPESDRVVPGADAEVKRLLLRVQVDRALAELPESQRAALMLREFGELRYAEIAETMSASLAEVKTWIYRARKQLSKLLDRDGQFIGAKTHGDY
jgi:RNA polymerase sigma-70 factor (ECF subfamily)